MTIKYNNKKGMEFIVDVKLVQEDKISVQIQVLSTQSASLAKKTFMIPYGHAGIIPPFDFNSLEEGIINIIKIMYKETTIGEFKQEDMIEIVDILMMQEAPVIDINVADEYEVYSNVSV
ncbi:C1 protein [Ageratum yellow vein Sri Lanka betasatellite]|uniref:C1 protein n=1 Tax=Ageratum yellow vein Sri Lanka betasatellite TaxID=2010317 RepID=Q70UF2_9VIRU|nr:C1 protein [Ageratum yellow vein Sri Lanka betasatellite]CAD65761.1 C1 protein [Ageratum yellow vein Sri Lanka betasatellite]